VGGVEKEIENDDNDNGKRLFGTNEKNGDKKPKSKIGPMKTMEKSKSSIMNTRELKRLEPSEGFTSKPDLTEGPVLNERKSTRTTKARDKFEPTFEATYKRKSNETN
jgi:hypothetical protein